MAKRKKPSRHGRSGDPRKRAEERAAEERALAESEATPELEDAVADALELGHPIDILMLASSMLASLDAAPIEAGDPIELPTGDEFVRMFSDSDDPDMVVFGWVIARLLGDEASLAETDRAIEEEWLPDWLAPLSQAQVVSAWQTTDPLRDSTDIVLSVRIGDADLSLVGLVDFNAEGALKDAFAVPVPLDDVQAALAAHGRPGFDRDLPLGDARAWLAQAIAAGSRIDPPFESDTWPQLRPLMEWALRMLPSTGEGWDRPSWTTAEVAELVEAFAASSEGDAVSDPEDRAVLVDALVTLGRVTYGDPRLLSAVKLETGLEWLWPTALHHDLDRLLTLPDTLAPYLRWTHAERGISRDDTDEALAAIAHRRAGYVRDVAEVLEP